MSKGKIFNAQEVQAIISRNKKMFREVIKNANYDNPVHSYKDWENNGLYYPVVTLVDENGTQFTETQYSFDGIRCPYQVGQKIFCKNLTLQIKEIRVERLKDISEEDAIAEGNYLDRCKCLPRGKDKSPIDAMFKQNWCHIHGQEFKDAWNATHKKPEEKFEANPWVWSIQFEVVK